MTTQRDVLAEQFDAESALIAERDWVRLNAFVNAQCDAAADRAAESAMRLIHPCQMPRDEAFDAVLARYTRFCPAAATPKPLTPNAAGRFSSQVTV